jgi:integrase
MSSRLPYYLTRNFHGIFVFQYRSSNQLRSIHPQFQLLFRRSLFTRDKREAIRKAKLWTIVMDELSAKLLNDPESYGRAMTLLKKYQQLEDFSWETVEDFLSQLSDGEEAILETAIQAANRGELKLANSSSVQNGTDQIFQQLLSAIQGLQPQVIIQQPLSQLAEVADDLPLDDITQRFIDYKQSKVTVGTTEAIRAKLDIFLKIIRENNDGRTIHLTELTQAQVRHYRDTLQKIPAYRNSFSEHATVNDWIRSGKKPLSAKTVKDTVVLIGEMFDWISHEGYPITKDLRAIFRTVKSPKADQKDIRVNFTDQELKLMFESDRYKKGECKSGSDFWVPLIALFTGARLGEIVQLYIGDIREEQGVWIFDINDDDEKQVKTQKGKRWVPIHSKLIELGLLEYWKERGKFSERLFPEEERAPNGKFGAFSKRFIHWKNGIGIVKADNTKKDFHSFRHTVRTKLTEASVVESLIDDIVGHQTVGSSTGKLVYTHTQLIPQKKEAIEKLKYDVNFSLIRPWNRHKLLQTIRNPRLKRAKLT